MPFSERNRINVIYSLNQVSFVVSVQKQKNKIKMHVSYQRK